MGRNFPHTGPNTALCPLSPSPGCLMVPDSALPIQLWATPTAASSLLRRFRHRATGSPPPWPAYISPQPAGTGHPWQRWLLLLWNPAASHPRVHAPAQHPPPCLSPNIGCFLPSSCTTAMRAWKSVEVWHASSFRADNALFFQCFVSPPVCLIV